MTKQIVVTAAQKNAAKGLVRSALARSETPRPAVTKIANARVEPLAGK